MHAGNPSHHKNIPTVPRCSRPYPNIRLCMCAIVVAVAVGVCMLHVLASCCFHAVSCCVRAVSVLCPCCVRAVSCCVLLCLSNSTNCCLFLIRLGDWLGILPAMDGKRGPRKLGQLTAHCPASSPLSCFPALPTPPCFVCSAPHALPCVPALLTLLVLPALPATSRVRMSWFSAGPAASDTSWEHHLAHSGFVRWTDGSRFGVGKCTNSLQLAMLTSQNCSTHPSTHLTDPITFIILTLWGDVEMIVTVWCWCPGLTLQVLDGGRSSLLLF